MRAFILASAAAAALSLSPSMLLAAEETLKLDPTHTTILYEVNHLGFSQSIGWMNIKDGSLILNTEDPTKSSLSVTIDAKSLFTGLKDRDAHVSNQDFLNTTQFPEITYRSTAIERTGERTARVTGDLTLLGVTRPVSMDVTLTGEGENPMSKAPTRGFSATGSLKRSDFGNTTFAPAIGDEVKFRIETEVVPAS